MLFWALRTLAVWIVISGAVIVVFNERDWFITAPAPAHQEAPAAARPPSNELIYRREKDGHFYVDADVSGTRVRFLVDTGATVVVLSPADARALGLNIGDRDFSGRATTANGVTRVAPVTLRTITLDQLTLFDVPGIVVEQDMPVSLLGMSFLRRLDSYETRDDQLVLRW